ncbi:MAG: isoprenylcysteine carboxylmethyltransferase family protein [Pseudomonadota bacterium]
MFSKPTWDFVGHEAKVIFWVLLALYWVSESIVVRRMRADGRDKVDDRGSLRLLALVFPFAWWSAIALAWVGAASLRSAPAFYAGLACMLAGQVLRSWSIAVLGRLFTVNVAVREGHRLIESGPYRYLRHPSYTAILLVHLGIGLCIGNALSLIALMVPIVVVLINRIRVEEEVLATGLGTYREYMNRTYRLVPGIY